MKRTTRRGKKEIRCNRPGWKKKVIDRHRGGAKYRHRGKKIKSKEWERTE